MNILNFDSLMNAEAVPGYDGGMQWRPHMHSKGHHYRQYYALNVGAYMQSF